MSPHTLDRLDSPPQVLCQSQHRPPSRLLRVLYHKCLTANLAGGTLRPLGLPVFGKG